MFLNKKIASGGTAEVYAYETDKSILSYLL